jgi:regulator of nonsense transcripts 1
LKLHPKAKTGTEVEVEFRIDATGTPRTSSHVRLTRASIPENRLVGANYTVDASVVFSETGCARFRCLHPLPPHSAECSWIIEDCGPFVTTKCMVDAVGDLNTLLEGCCGIAGTILRIAPLPAMPLPEQTWNSSQNQAISLALNNRLLCF